MHSKESKKSFRKDLRRSQSIAERKLWSLLRSRQLMGYKFRRQHSIGNAIADFCCLERRLIIELDGGHHLEQQAYDQARTDYLCSMGFRVLRVWNHHLLLETGAVLDVIQRELGRSIDDCKNVFGSYQWKNRPSPSLRSPLPSRERNKETNS